MGGEKIAITFSNWNVAFNSIINVDNKVIYGLFLVGATASSGSEPPHSRGF